SPGYEEAVVRAVEAGAHVLCLGTSIRRDDQQMLREAHDALVEAVASGRLPREILRERAEETRARCRRLRVRRRVVPAGGLEDAIPRAEERVAARAGGEPASGARPQQLVAAPPARGLRAETPQYPAQIQGAPQIIALTRLPRSDLQEGRRLQELLRARPDTVVVHLGVPDAAP